MKTVVNPSRACLALGILAAGVACAEAQSPVTVQVGDFGAVPDDGTCDAAAFRTALDSVDGVTNVVVQFDAGVYSLFEGGALEHYGHVAMLHVRRQTNWTLRGTVDAEGAPATTLEMSLRLRNEVSGASHFDIRYSKDVALEHFVLDQDPRFATAAEVVAVNTTSHTVTIDVLEGMPHFDGMASFSANNWDLGTRRLVPGPPVTIGVNPGAFPTWAKVVGFDRRYEVEDAGISQLVQVGEGLSFHFNITAPDARCIDAYTSEGLRFENLLIYNVIGMALGAGDNRDMTFRKFHVIPEGPSLAVGPRDGIHISRSGGRLLMEDVAVKGVRWDPLVTYMQFVPITERSGTDRIRLDGSNGSHAKVLAVAEPGSAIYFWSGTEPSTGTVSVVQGDTIIFTAALDTSVVAGSTLTPGAWHWEEATIRKCLFESNYGTPIVYQSDNLVVEHTIFRNNAYSNIGLGPSSENAGAFVRNIVIRNNLFEDSTWQDKYPDYRGTITLYNNHSAFSNEPYHRDIRIEQNLFRNITGANTPAAIHVKNAGDVLIQDNRYENTDLTVLVDAGSTDTVVLNEIDLPRNTGASHTIDAIPGYLDDATVVTFPRGANAPVPPFSFQSTNALTVFLAVHDRGTPTIPTEWILQPGRTVWRTSNFNALEDKVYRRDFPAGTIDIPGHDGFSGSFYGVPHMLYLFPGPGEAGGMDTNGFPAVPEPTFHLLDLDLVWMGDGKTPFSWAAEVGFCDGSALSVYEGYLLNRRDLESAFRLVSMLVDHNGYLELAWSSDGLPNGEAILHSRGSLDVSGWSPVPGGVSFENEYTRWCSAAPTPSDRLKVHRMEVKDRP
jgi:hypothetical protein